MLWVFFPNVFLVPTPSYLQRWPIFKPSCALFFHVLYLGALLTSLWAVSCVALLCHGLLHGLPFSSHAGAVLPFCGPEHGYGIRPVCHMFMCASVCRISFQKGDYNGIKGYLHFC